MMKIYGNRTENGVEITDMIDSDNDIVYLSKDEKFDKFFARVVMNKNTDKPAIAIFKWTEPFHAIFALDLKAKYTGRSNESFNRELENCFKEYGRCM